MVEEGMKPRSPKENPRYADRKRGMQNGIKKGVSQNHLRTGGAAYKERSLRAKDQRGRPTERREKADVGLPADPSI